MSRRQGECAARHKVKATASTRPVAPVRGGPYRRLAVTDIETIHDAALTKLDEIGMDDSSAELIDLAAHAGYGMPVGLQIIGPGGRDDLLRMARDFDGAKGLHP